MEIISFEWDHEKNKQNTLKHGVSFEDAQSAFYDETARLMHDPDHSADEERFVLMGHSRNADLLVVIHSYRQNNEVIRIISARKANRLETKNYFYFRGI
jgi:hypothetical protein